MHKYLFLYQQCENTFDYDGLIKRLERYKIFLSILDVNCRNNKVTLLSESELPEAYNELIDFLDGNGFIIKRFNDSNIVHIIPIKKENVK